MIHRYFHVSGNNTCKERRVSFSIFVIWIYFYRRTLISISQILKKDFEDFIIWYFYLDESFSSEVVELHQEKMQLMQDKQTLQIDLATANSQLAGLQDQVLFLLTALLL